MPRRSRGLNAKFLCKIQLAKDQPHEFTEKGEVSYEQFLVILASVDWEFESDRFQFLKRTWPTIAVTNQVTGATLRMSAYRPLPPDFLNKDEFRRNMAIWFVTKLDCPPYEPEIVESLGRKKYSDCYFETYDMSQIENLFERFFDDDYETVYESLGSMRVVDVNEF